MMHHMPTCPIPTEHNASMNPQGRVCNANPPDPYACHMEFSCNDLCQFCKLHCSGTCSGITSYYDSELIRDSNDFSVDLYPNPSSNAIRFQINRKFPTTHTCSLYDYNGKRVYFLVLEKSQSTFCIDLQQLRLHSGIYFFVVEDGTETNISRLIFY